MCVRHERRGIVGGELFVFLLELRVLVSFAERFLNNLDPVVRGAGRQNDGLLNRPEGRLSVTILRSISELARLSSSGT